MARNWKKSRRTRAKGPDIDPRMFSPPYGPGREGGQEPAPARKPLLSTVDSSAVANWSWSDHAIQRMEERGIGVFEVLSALYAPDWTTTTQTEHGEARRIARGDVEVVYEPDTRVIVTVTDRLSERRTKKREPLIPMTTTHVAPHDMHPAAEKPAAEPIPQIAAELKEESKDIVVTTQEKPTAMDAVKEWVEAHPAGYEFAVWDLVLELVERGYKDGAIRQAVAQWRNRHLLIPADLNVRTGRYRVLASRVETRQMSNGIVPVATTEEAAASVALDGETQTPGPVTVSEEPATALDLVEEDTTRALGATLETVGRHARDIVTTFEIETPPRRPGGDSGASEYDPLVEHIAKAVETLRKMPGVSAKVAIVEGNTQKRTHRVQYLKRRLEKLLGGKDPSIVWTSRTLPDGTSAVYIRVSAEGK